MVQRLNFSPSGGTLAVAPSGTVRFWDVAKGGWMLASGGASENFMRIGHSLLALVMAILGGNLSRWLHAGGSGRSD